MPAAASRWRSGAEQTRASQYGAPVARHRALFVLALALGCTEQAKPLIEAPGARAVLAGADAAAALAWATRAGVPVPPGASLFAAGAPWAASVLPRGELVVVVGTGGDAAVALGAALTGTPVLGEVRAIGGDGSSTLVRPDHGRVLLAPGVAAERTTELAAILEVMATAAHPAVVSAPRDDALRVRVADELLPLGTVELRVEGSAAGELVVRATAPHAAPEVVAALTAPAPTWVCALDDGALLVLAVPPLGPASLDDAFDGAMVVALYPRGDEPASDDDPLPHAALVVAGVPRSSGSIDELRALLPSSTRDERAGARRSLTTETGRRVQVVADERLLAVGYGAGAPVSRIDPHTPCPSAARPLVAGDLAAAARALPGLLPRELGLADHVPVVARVALDGGTLSLELRARLPAAVPF